MKKSLLTKERTMEIIFVMVVFSVLFYLTVVTPFNASPDEYMRYDIVDFIIRRGTLPDGRDPEIRSELWGISYAFHPITSYIVGAFFARITMFFTESKHAIIVASRFVNVLLGTGTAWFALKAGKKAFNKEAGWLFASLVAFLPGAMFVHTYINMDSIAVFSAAWIVYCWVIACEEGWHTKLCVQLAVALSVCALSYYNAYGYLLCSALFFAGMMLKCQEKQWEWKPMFKKGFLILGLVALLAGWWFIRCGILYDGDFLGMSTSSQYAELYAIDELKPSNIYTPQKQGMSVPGMMFFVPTDWSHNWIITVSYSFIGTFGYMDIFMPERWSQLYVLCFFGGIVGCCVGFTRNFSINIASVSEEKIEDEEGVTQIIKIRKNKKWNARNWMHACMVLVGVITFSLLVYYSYCSDFQAQGRYIMPAVVPFMYFITLGYDCLLTKLVKNETVRKWLIRIFTIGVMASGILVYVCVYLPNYL